MLWSPHVGLHHPRRDNTVSCLAFVLCCRCYLPADVLRHHRLKTYSEESVFAEREMRIIIRNDYADEDDGRDLSSLMRLGAMQSTHMLGPYSNDIWQAKMLPITCN